MKFQFRGTILLILVMVVAFPVIAQLDLPRPSPLGKVHQRVGMTDIQIEFYRPGVKNCSKRCAADTDCRLQIADCRLGSRHQEWRRSQMAIFMAKVMVEKLP